MFRPLALYIGLRYTRAKRRNRFISFISLASILGIALGVTVLITVLSVMNGFDYQIRARFFSLAPMVTVLTGSNISKTWPQWQSKIASGSDVTGVAPYVSGKGMLIRDGQVSGVEVLGIMPKQQNKVSVLSSKVVQGSLASLTSKSFHMVIGASLAKQLGLQVGDKINLLTPQTTVTLAGVFPIFRQFTISGIFKTGGGFGFERGVAYINMQDAERLFPLGQRTSGFYVKLNDMYQAPWVSLELTGLLPETFETTTWMQQAGAFFQALKMEKTMLFVILLLIIAVAVFNLISTLVMVVNEKRADIAILRTLGATPGTIMLTFIIQGAVVGLFGTLLGLIGGVLLALNVTALTNAVQNLFHVQFVSANVFFLNYLPSRLQLSDIIQVCAISLGLSLLATIYPAWTAFRTQPAEALRYE